jgi:hypothetical protein
LPPRLTRAAAVPPQNPGSPARRRCHKAAAVHTLAATLPLLSCSTRAQSAPFPHRYKLLLPAFTTPISSSPIQGRHAPIALPTACGLPL